MSRSSKDNLVKYIVPHLPASIHLRHILISSLCVSHMPTEFFDCDSFELPTAPCAFFRLIEVERYCFHFWPDGKFMLI